MEARIIDNQSSLDDVLELLRVSKLPYEDLQLKDNLFISYHDLEGKMIGSGGLEFYSQYALLRSVAVDENLRGKSIGKEIVDDLLSRAKQRSVKEVYLLTETAHDFFLKKGFSDVARDNVPEAIKASTEFSSVCPVSASVMIYRLGMKKVLVLCTGNSYRSQMAEGYIRHFAGDKAMIKSAGVETHGVNPKAILTMKEDGIDISGHTSNNVDEYVSIEFDYIITVCDNAKERCPVFPSKAFKFHHNFPDPAKATGSDGEIRDKFRYTRDLIREYCRDFVSKHIN